MPKQTNFIYPELASLIEAKQQVEEMIEETKEVERTHSNQFEVIESQVSLIVDELIKVKRALKMTIFISSLITSLLLLIQLWRFSK